MKDMHKDEAEFLNFLSMEIIPALIYEAAETKDPDRTRIYAAALAAAVTGNILQTVLEIFDDNEEEMPHGPRS